MTPTRRAVLQALADLVPLGVGEHAVWVGVDGVDGVDGAGKTPTLRAGAG